MTAAVLTKTYPSIVEATELPKIIRLGPNLYAAAFSLMKLLPARHIIDTAEAQGALTPGTRVIETSSGTFGLGLALVCRLKGYPLTIVGDSAIDAELTNRLRLLGATVEIVTHRGQPGGIQGARLERVEQLRLANPGSFVPDQYGNPANPGAYGVVADHVIGTLGGVDCIVGPVGSGGSSGGLADSMRQCNPALHLVGVDTHGSVIFGSPEAPRALRGLGSGIHPRNVRHTAYDEVHWVTAAEAFAATRELYQRHGLFMGPTSGASFQVGAWWAAVHPYSSVLIVLPDEGYRYQSTVYNDGWLHANGLDAAVRPGAPVTVEHPEDSAPTWSRLLWARRDLTAVMSKAAMSKAAMSKAAMSKAAMSKAAMSKAGHR